MLKVSIYLFDHIFCPAAPLLKLGPFLSACPRPGPYPARPAPEPGCGPSCLPACLPCFSHRLGVPTLGTHLARLPASCLFQQRPPHFSPLRFVGCLKLSNGVNQWSVCALSCVSPSALKSSTANFLAYLLASPGDISELEPASMWTKKTELRAAGTSDVEVWPTS